MGFELLKFLGGKEKETTPVVPENAPIRDLSGLEGITPNNIPTNSVSGNQEGQEEIDPAFAKAVGDALGSIKEELAEPAPILPSKTPAQQTPVRGGAQEAAHGATPEESLQNGQNQNGKTATMTSLAEHQATGSGLSAPGGGLIPNGNIPENFGKLKQPTQPESQVIESIPMPKTKSKESADSDMEALKKVREKIASKNITSEEHTTAVPEIAPKAPSNEIATKIMGDVIEGLESESAKEHSVEAKQDVMSTIVPNNDNVAPKRMENAPVDKETDVDTDKSEKMSEAPERKALFEAVQKAIRASGNNNTPKSELKKVA